MNSFFKEKLSAVGRAIRNFFTAEVGRPVPQPVAAAHSGCAHIQALLLHLCDGDEQRALWVKRWLALPLRQPGAKMQTALIVNGGQGSGKSLFFQQVAARLHGEHARCIADRELRNNFNAWAAGQPRLVVVDAEIKYVMSKLKFHVMTDSVVIERKGLAPVCEKSMMNFVLLSGDPDPLRHLEDRRFFVLEAPYRQPAAFYNAVVDEISAGGVDAFMSHLMDELDMGQFDARTPMPNAAGGLCCDDPGAWHEKPPVPSAL